MKLDFVILALVAAVGGIAHADAVTSRIIFVKSRFSVNRCARSIERSSSALVDAGYPDLGVLYVRANDTDAKLIQHLHCVSNIEDAGEEYSGSLQCDEGSSAAQEAVLRRIENEKSLPNWPSCRASASTGGTIIGSKVFFAVSVTCPNIGRTLHTSVDFPIESNACDLNSGEIYGDL